MTGRPGRVCVVGSVNIDTSYLVPAIPRAGETVLASGRVVAPGGKGANQAVAAAAMGSAVAFVGCVGDDPEAALALASLTGRGVDAAGVTRVPGAATGTAGILVSADGENVIAVDPGANARLTPALVEAGLAAASADVVLAQLEVPLAAVEAAARARGAALLVLNPAPIPADPAGVRALLPLVDVLVPNRGELARLAGVPVPATRADLDAAVAALGFAGTVVVTLGGDGVAVYPGGGRAPEVLEPVRVATVDTTGAGDAFCAVLAHGLAAGEDVVAAARTANAKAALSTTVVGARVPAGLFRADAAG